VKHLELNRIVQQMAKASGRSVDSVMESMKEASDAGDKSFSSVMYDLQQSGAKGIMFLGPLINFGVHQDLSSSLPSSPIAWGSSLALGALGVYAMKVVGEAKRDNLMRLSIESVRAEIPGADAGARLSMVSSSGLSRLWATMKANVEAVLDTDNSRIKEAIAAGDVHTDPLIQGLVDRRISLGLSRQQLGDQVGLSRFDIAQIETHGFSEIADMPEDKMLAMYKALGVSDAMVDVHASKAYNQLANRISDYEIANQW